MHLRARVMVFLSIHRRVQMTQIGRKDDKLAGASDDNDEDDSTCTTIHLRRDALRQGPPFHGRLILHVLDLLLQCVLVHGGEYTGIHGYSRTPLVANRGTG